MILSNLFLYQLFLLEKLKIILEKAHFTWKTRSLQNSCRISLKNPFIMKRIGDFLLDEVIGAGSYGVVYKGHR